MLEVKKIEIQSLTIPGDDCRWRKEITDSVNANVEKIDDIDEAGSELVGIIETLTAKVDEEVEMNLSKLTERVEQLERDTTRETDMMYDGSKGILSLWDRVEQVDALLLRVLGVCSESPETAHGATIRPEHDHRVEQEGQYWCDKCAKTIADKDVFHYKGSMSHTFGNFSEDGFCEYHQVKFIPSPTETPQESVLRPFQKEVRTWATETFPSQTRQSILAHLRKEVKELRESGNPEEAADCLLLLLDYAEFCGFDLLEASKAKLAINRTREWGEPDHEGVFEHVETPEAEEPKWCCTASFGEHDPTCKNYVASEAEELEQVDVGHILSQAERIVRKHDWMGLANNFERVAPELLRAWNRRGVTIGSRDDYISVLRGQIERKDKEIERLEARIQHMRETAANCTLAGRGFRCDNTL